MSKLIEFLIFPEFQLLDISGPIAALEMANRLSPKSYSIKLVSKKGGLVKSSSGVEIDTVKLSNRNSTDTLIVAGGNGVFLQVNDLQIIKFIQHGHLKCRRIASVCTGAYLLATAGILKNKKATTHWKNGPDFIAKFPDTFMNPDKIFIKDGNVWTSAGISAGIDLTLALIDEDLGEQLARSVAQQLVVYYRRPGGQSQYSALLELSGGIFSELLDYIRKNIDKPLSINHLSDIACMSPRHFARVFSAEIGVTPAKAVEQIRIEAASAILESGRGSMQVIAKQCGFISAERMRRTFVRNKGLSALALKQNSF
ncbi:MAG: hypothetical protein RLZZ601_886 [Pseudomonadota bacterium]|jgi:transcriptional regulator GlxA family with amidase domain